METFTAKYLRSIKSIVIYHENGVAFACFEYGMYKGVVKHQVREYFESKGYMINNHKSLGDLDRTEQLTVSKGL